MAKKQITVEARDGDEAAAIERALQDPTTLATVKIVGYLLPMSDRERRRVMTWVTDKINEANGD